MSQDHALLPSRRTSQDPAHKCLSEHQRIMKTSLGFLIPISKFKEMPAKSPNGLNCQVLAGEGPLHNPCFYPSCTWAVFLLLGVGWPRCLLCAPNPSTCSWFLLCVFFQERNKWSSSGLAKDFSLTLSNASENQPLWGADWWRCLASLLRMSAYKCDLHTTNVYHLLLQLCWRW